MLEELKLARTRLSNDKPYFAGALWTCRFVESDKVPTMGVDKYWRMYYNKEFVLATHKRHGIKGIMFLLVHELAHLLRRHGDRANLNGITRRLFNVWNVAADLEINDDLVHDTQLVALKDIQHPKTYEFPEGLSTEEYYEKLFQEGHVQEVDPEGSGVTGSAAEWEEGEAEGGPSKFQREAVIKDTARRIRESSKARGNCTEGWRRWAEDELNTKVDWRKELAAILRNAVAELRGLVDYTYRRPCRRQAAFGQVIMPSMFTPNPNPAVVIDTSGSMSDTDLSACLAELKGILQAVGLRGVRYYAVDAEVCSTKTVTSIRQVELKGGGGTEMGVGIGAALKATPRPDLIVVLTDGYTPWPETPTPCRMVVCMIGTDCDGPAWAKTIKVKHDERP
jgi:predicted metal-dependent peptidase